MKRIFNELIFGRSPYFGAIVATLVIGAMVLGCTCTEKDGFQWNSSSSDSESTSSDDTSTKKETTSKSDASKGEIPESDELEEMVKKTLLDFDKGLKDEDFGNFYNNIAEEWQKQTSPRQLKKQFQNFIDGKADISSIRNLEMDLDGRPKIEDVSGYEMLVVKGSFDTSPRTTTFDVKYIAEGKEWKLSAIKVETSLKFGGSSYGPGDGVGGAN